MKTGSRQYRIDPKSYKNGRGRWFAKAVVSWAKEGAVFVYPIFGPIDRGFPSEREANSAAVELAMSWVEQQEKKYRQ